MVNFNEPTETRKIPIKGYSVWIEAKLYPVEGSSFGRNIGISGTTKSEVCKKLMEFLKESEKRSVSVKNKEIQI
jgi:hypothetical protein